MEYSQFTMISTPPNADGKPVVEVDHMLNNMTFGILYKSCTEEQRRALMTLT